MIKTSKHSIKFSNTEKINKINDFINQYQIATQFYINILWNRKFIVNDIISNIQNNQLANFTFHPCPKKVAPKETPLSARALKCAQTQANAMVKAATAKRQKQLFQLKKLQREGKDSRKLQRKIDRQPLVKPTADDIFPELNSVCAKFFVTPLLDFDGILILGSIGKKYKKIILPIKFHKHSNKLSSTGEMMKSFIISNKNVDFRWKLPTPEKMAVGRTVGADQGISTCVTLSDAQVTQKCPHGHDLGSIITHMKSRAKGSNAFKKAQSHRKNYINWSINQLNFGGIKELRLEHLFQVGTGRKRSRFLSHFTYRNIYDKLVSHCEINGVRLVLQSSAYRSQRCSGCGYVHPKNRNAKLFKCKNCNLTKDADLNAAINHEQRLLPCPINGIDRSAQKAFFWLTEREPTVLAKC